MIRSETSEEQSSPKLSSQRYRCRVSLGVEIRIACPPRRKTSAHQAEVLSSLRSWGDPQCGNAEWRFAQSQHCGGGARLDSLCLIHEKKMGLRTQNRGAEAHLLFVELPGSLAWQRRWALRAIAALRGRGPLDSLACFTNELPGSPSGNAGGALRAEHHCGGVGPLDSRQLHDEGPPPIGRRSCLRRGAAGNRTRVLSR